jgi:hypothetical protein
VRAQTLRQRHRAPSSTATITARRGKVSNLCTQQVVRIFLICRRAVHVLGVAGDPEVSRLPLELLAVIGMS